MLKTRTAATVAALFLAVPSVAAAHHSAPTAPAKRVAGGPRQPTALAPRMTVRDDFPQGTPAT